MRGRLSGRIYLVPGGDAEEFKNMRGEKKKCEKLIYVLFI